MYIQESAEKWALSPMHSKPATVIYTSTYCMNNTAEHLSLTKSFENFAKQNLFLKI